MRLATLTDITRVCALVLGFLWNIAAGQSRPFPPDAEPDIRQRQEPESLARIETAPVDKLIAILSQPDVHVRVPDETVLGHTMYSVWLRAKCRLYGREMHEAARPGLAAMLHDECGDTRANALEVLLRHPREHLVPLKPRLLELTTDTDRKVRTGCFKVLAKTPCAEVEAALLQALPRAGTVDQKEWGADDKEILEIVQALCVEPTSPVRVAAEVVPLIDESRSSFQLVWVAMRDSSQLSRSEEFGGELIARYWSILTNTGSTSLADVAAHAMSTDDPRTLALLRRVGEITNPFSRACAASRLVSHSLFTPRKESQLIQALMGDPSELVRRFTISSLCSRETDRKFALETSFKVIESDPEPDVRAWAISGVFWVLSHAPEVDQSRLLADNQLNVAGRMLKAFETEEHRRTMLCQTARLAREGWSQDDHDALDKCRAWWETRRSN